MPFENRFIIAQRGPTTYRFLGADLKTAKNKVQAKNVSAKVPTPAPIKPPTPPKLPTRPEGDNRGDGREQDRVPGVPKGNKFAADLGEVTFKDFTSQFGRPEVIAATAVSTVAGGIMAASGALTQATARNRRERVSKRSSFVDTEGPGIAAQKAVQQQMVQEGMTQANQRASQQAAAKAAMTQATKAPTQNVRTGAQRGGEGGQGVRGGGGFGSETYGPSGRGSTGGGRDNGGFDNGGFSRDSGFGGWT